MNIDIRKSIKNNFKNSNDKEIISSIEKAIKDNDEITLPGLGVFFEILWKNCDTKEKNNIINIIKGELK